MRWLQLVVVLIYLHGLIILPASGRFCFDVVVTAGVGIDLLAQIGASSLGFLMVAR
jgi:hypothetical protein